jgi:hypothetical protein
VESLPEMFDTKPYIFEDDTLINFTDTKLQELHKIKYEPFQTAWIKEKGKLELAHNRRPYNIQDIPFPSPRTKWVTMQEELQTKLQMIKPFWNILATFGKDKVSEFHVEELTASQIVKLLIGEKHWEFWAPGRDPEQHRLSKKIIQKAGEDLYIPGGWWHRVTTKSNGALLVGVIFRERDTPVVFGRCLREIGVHQAHQGYTPQSIENQAQILIKQMNIRLSGKKGVRIGVQGRAAKRLQMEAFRKQGGAKNKRRDVGGKVRLRPKRSRKAKE